MTTKAPAPPSNGTSLTVEVAPKRPKAGETVHFVVTASQPGNCCYLGIQPGDGGSAAPATGSRSCTAGQGGTQRAEFTYVYNRPGTWTAVARSDAGRACDIANTPPLPPPTTTPALPQLVASVTVVVAEGATTAQGPEPPGLEGVTLTPAADGRVALQASALRPGRLGRTRRGRLG